MNRTIPLAPLLLGALALSAPLRAHPPAMHGGMHDDLFATMDADHDGRISTQEHAAAADAMFARADANQDGAVTLDEMQAMHAPHGDRDARQADRQAPADTTTGAPTADAATKPAMPAMDHDDRMPAQGGMHHDMDMRGHFKAMDTDGDGRISAGEHAAGAARMFAGMDSDHDGFLSRAEFDAGRAAMPHGGAGQ